MTFAAPGYLLAAALAAAVVVALHLLVRRRPPSAWLPTARFIPDAPAVATAIATWPSDVALLLLRAAVLLLAGAALAEPRLTPARGGTARILVVDLSRGGDRAAAVDSARARLDGAAAVVVLDSTARELGPFAADSLARLAARPAAPVPGSLSAALVVSLRAASRERERADSVALVLVTPALAEERDRATRAIRARWPGRIDVVRVAAAPPPGEALERVRVVWADSAPSADWRRRDRADAPGAVRAGDVVVVAPFERRWIAAPGTARVIARWLDGEPAGVERPTPTGCERSLGFAIPQAGDVPLRADVLRLEAAVREAPCGSRGDLARLDAPWLDTLRGGARLAAASAFAASAPGAAPLSRWLLAAALALALLELPLRRRGAASRVEAT